MALTVIRQLCRDFGHSLTGNPSKTGHRLRRAKITRGFAARSTSFGLTLETKSNSFADDRFRLRLALVRTPRNGLGGSARSGLEGVYAMTVHKPDSGSRTKLEIEPKYRNAE